MTRLLSLSTVSLLFFLVGCSQSALGTLSRENTERERRITEKIHELDSVQAQHRLLIARQKDLLRGLDERQMTLAELNAELESLRRANARTTSETEIEQKKKEDLESHLRRYQEGIATLRSDARLPAEEKRRRINELKKQIKTYLQLMTVQ